MSAKPKDKGKQPPKDCKHNHTSLEIDVVEYCGVITWKPRNFCLSCGQDVILDSKSGARVKT